MGSKHEISVYKFFTAIFLLLLLHIPFSYSQEEWETPPDQSKKVSPFKFDDESQKKGEEIFQNNCTKCHGIVGKNNPVPLTPSPGDPASYQFQREPDGDLFYKITTGHGLMPSFKDVLSETQRWQVISYFRSFHKNYVQPEPVTAPAGIYAGVNVDLEMCYLDDKDEIIVTAKGTKGNVTKPLAGIEIALFAKSYFGNLPVDKPLLTNADGEAYFSYAKKLNGDSLGDVNFLLKINTEGLESVKKEKTLRAGIPILAKSLIATRAMWSVRSQAPRWLILAYSLSVIIVWGMIFNIIGQIIKVRNIGKR